MYRVMFFMGCPVYISSNVLHGLSSVYSITFAMARLVGQPIGEGGMGSRKIQTNLGFNTNREVLNKGRVSSLQRVSKRQRVSTDKGFQA